MARLESRLIVLFVAGRIQVEECTCRKAFYSLPSWWSSWAPESCHGPVS